MKSTLITIIKSTNDGSIMQQIEGVLLDYKEGDNLRIQMPDGTGMTTTDEYEVVDRDIDFFSVYGHTIQRIYYIHKLQ